MTEEQPQRDPAQREAEGRPESSVDAAAAGPVSTGHPAVDEVLRSMERLDELSVTEHVAAFEEAHEALRRSLADGDAGPE